MKTSTVPAKNAMGGDRKKLKGGGGGGKGKKVENGIERKANTELSKREGDRVREKQGKRK